MSKEEIEKAIGRIREEYFINGIGARYTEIYTDDLKILLDYADGLEKFNREVIEHKTNLECKIGELEEERDGIYADYQDLGKAYYDSIPKQVIRDKILYYKSFGIHKVNNGLIGEKFSEWTEYVMQDEIDILNELLEEDV